MGAGKRLPLTKGKGVTNFSEYWNKGAGVAYGNCFTEDADYVTFMGQHLKGRKQIADVHQMLFNGLLKGFVLVFSSTSGTNVVRKQNGEWKLTAFHNCRIQDFSEGKR